MSNIDLTNRFNTFFTNKILNTCQQLVENSASLEHNIYMAENKLPCKESFSFFSRFSLQDIKDIIIKFPYKSSELHPISMELLKDQTNKLLVKS